MGTDFWQVSDSNGIHNTVPSELSGRTICLPFNFEEVLPLLRNYLKNLRGALGAVKAQETAEITGQPTSWETTLEPFIDCAHMEKVEDIAQKIDVMNYLRGNILVAFRICTKAALNYIAIGDFNKSRDWTKRLQIALVESLKMDADRGETGHVELSFMIGTNASYPARELYTQFTTIIEVIKTKSTIILHDRKSNANLLIDILQYIHQYLSIWEKGRIGVPYYVESRKLSYPEQVGSFQKDIDNWVASNMENSRVSAGLIFTQIERMEIEKLFDGKLL